MLKIVNTAAAICLGFYTQICWAETVFTARGPESYTDKRQDYTYQLLDLALSKTTSSHGPYRLEMAPPGATIKRSMLDLERGAYPNFFVRQSVSSRLMKEFVPVPFPIDRGIVGYRVAFTSERTKQKLAEVSTLDELRRFSIIQGLGWLDIKILEANGFEVVTSGSYESLFRMVARDRADLFTRGANELLDEWESHKSLTKLTYDQTFALYYPLPRFFFTLKGNEENARRVYEGLVAAYEDGSLVALWEQYYGASIEFVQLEKRKLFRLENPFLADLDPAYEAFLFNPIAD
ncbi:hypothetical protein ACTL6U_15840 [Rhodovibrionaceae bacterium A322]